MLQKILIIAAVLVIMIFSSGCTPHSNGKWIEMEGGRIINLATVQKIHTSAPNTTIYFDRDSWQFSDTKEGDATFEKIRRFLASGDSYLKIK